MVKLRIDVISLKHEPSRVASGSDALVRISANSQPGHQAWHCNMFVGGLVATAYTAGFYTLTAILF